jgi:Ca-activated chloride channel homolog
MENIPKRLTLILLLSSVLQPAFAQNIHDILRKADNNYTNKKYPEAQELYSAASLVNKDKKIYFNMGNTVYKQNNLDNALKIYENVINSNVGDEIKFKAYYNKGNVHYHQKKYEDAVQSYKSALKINPNDEEGRMNYALALKMLKAQQKEQKRQDKNKENKDKPKEKEENKKDSIENKNQQNNTDPQQREIDKNEAKKLLEIMNYEENKVQKRVNKNKIKIEQPTKDW